MSKRKVIMDVDPGIDDARSMLFYLYSGDVDIVAVTINGGNTYSVQTAYNAGCVLRSVNRCDIPIYMSSPYNLDGEILEGDEFYGKNALCDLILLPPTSQPNLDIPAEQAMVDFVNKFPKEISILSLGPTTNLARAYMIDNDLPNKIDRLYVMGTDRAENTTFNVTKYAEFNSYKDPQAMSIVLTCFGLSPNSPINLVDFTLCLQHPIKGSFFDGIADIIIKDPTKKSVEELFRARPDEFYADESIPLEQKTLNIADEFSALICYDNDVMSDSHRVFLESIEFSAEKRGHTVYKDDTNGNILLADKIDEDKFHQLYTTVMSNTI